MSEKEIIKNTKAILEHYQKIKNIKDPIERDIESSCYIEEMPFNELQGLLDLYNKEKSRIMELAELLDKQESEIKSLQQELEIQKGCSISKDKIKAKIKELENLQENQYIHLDYTKKILEELLKE